MELSLLTPNYGTSITQIHQKAESPDDANDDCCPLALKIAFLVIGIFIGITMLFLVKLQLALLVSSFTVGLPVIVLTRDQWRHWRPNFFFPPSTYVPSSSRGFTGGYPEPHHSFGSGRGRDSFPSRAPSSPGYGMRPPSYSPSSYASPSAPPDSPPRGPRSDRHHFGSGSSPSVPGSVGSAPPPGSSHAFGSGHPRRDNRDNREGNGGCSQQ